MEINKVYCIKQNHDNSQQELIEFRLDELLFEAANQSTQLHVILS